jgi:hypothetical protein
MNNELKTVWKEAVMAQLFDVTRRICQEGVRKTVEKESKKRKVSFLSRLFNERYRYS